MDDFDLGFLGDKKIIRASEIVFNEDTQLWDVFAGTKHPLATAYQCCAGFTTYEFARKFEVLWFQNCAIAGVEPSSKYGLLIASTVREDPTSISKRLAKINPDARGAAPRF